MTPVKNTYVKYASMIFSLVGVLIEYLNHIEKEQIEIEQQKSWLIHLLVQEFGHYVA